LAYKAFDADFICRGMQYAVGQTFTHDGPVEACSSGLHACERPLDVLRYYRPGTSRFATVRATGSISRHADDSKVAAASLTIEAEIGLPEIISKTIAWTLARCTPAEGAHATKDNESAKTSEARKSATASGNYGAATASGNYGAATASGSSSAATASGYCGAATASGYSGAATASGDYGAATASGDYGAATASGYCGAATASGYCGAATASGNYGAATASGYCGAATASGYSGAATASGNSGAATASGDYGAATASGYSGAATASGNYGKARGNSGCALFLVERNIKREIIAVWAGIAGRDEIKPDTFYRLVNGLPVEASS
jgi:hypothetical protein